MSEQQDVSDVNREFCQKRSEFLKEKKKQDQQQNYYGRSFESTLFATALAASDQNVSEIAANEPKTKLGLITFESNVHIYGDCSNKPITLKENILNNEKSIKDFVDKSGPQMLTKPIN